MTSTPYENNWEHLSAEFALLDLLVRREALGSRAAPDGDSTTGAQLEELRASAAALRLEIDERSRATLERGTFLALPHVAQLFGLSPFETGAVAVCLALEADLRYERLYALLQDDPTRKRPSVDVILRLLTSTPGERLRARAFFAPQAA